MKFSSSSTSLAFATLTLSPSLLSSPVLGAPTPASDISLNPNSGHFADTPRLQPAESPLLLVSPISQAGSPASKITGQRQPIKRRLSAKFPSSGLGLGDFGSSSLLPVIIKSEGDIEISSGPVPIPLPLPSGATLSTPDIQALGHRYPQHDVRSVPIAPLTGDVSNNPTVSNVYPGASGLYTPNFITNATPLGSLPLGSVGGLRLGSLPFNVFDSSATSSTLAGPSIPVAGNALEGLRGIGETIDLVGPVLNSAKDHAGGPLRGGAGVVGATPVFIPGGLGSNLPIGEAHQGATGVFPVPNGSVLPVLGGAIPSGLPDLGSPSVWTPGSPLGSIPIAVPTQLGNIPGFLPIPQGGPAVLDIIGSSPSGLGLPGANKPPIPVANGFPLPNGLLSVPGVNNAVLAAGNALPAPPLEQLRPAGVLPSNAVDIPGLIQPPTSRLEPGTPLLSSVPTATGIIGAIPGLVPVATPSPILNSVGSPVASVTGARPVGIILSNSGPMPPGDTTVFPAITPVPGLPLLTDGMVGSLKFKDSQVNAYQASGGMGAMGRPGLEIKAKEAQKGKSGTDIFGNDRQTLSTVESPTPKSTEPEHISHSGASPAITASPSIAWIKHETSTEFMVNSASVWTGLEHRASPGLDVIPTLSTISVSPAHATAPVLHIEPASPGPVSSGSSISTSSSSGLPRIIVTEPVHPTPVYLGGISLSRISDISSVTATQVVPTGAETKDMSWGLGLPRMTTSVIRSASALGAKPTHG